MTTVTETVHTHDVEVGEYRLHVHEVGDPKDPTVLWLHGSGPGVSALSNWEPLITSMPGLHHVAPDILGFADSSHPLDAPRGMAAGNELRADVLVGLLDTLGVDRTHLVGNSMGGMISVRMVQRIPDRIDRIVLMGSGGAPSSPTAALRDLATFYKEPTPAAMRSLLTSFMYDTSVFADDIDEIAERRVAVATRPEVRRSHEATFDLTAGPPKPFTEDELAAITNEVLVIHGRDDQVIPFESALYFLKNLPNAQLHILPHAGHWVQIEQVDRFRAEAQVFFGEGR